jgi:hypothetical protein
MEPDTVEAIARVVATAGGALLFHLLSKLYERTSVMIITNLALANGRVYLAMPG